MSASLDTLQAEFSISDPWEVASILASPLRGTVTQFAGDAVAVRLDESVAVNGVAMSFAIATPRHVGVHFERSGRSVAANVVLSACERPPLTGLGEYQQAAAQAPFIAAIGTVSFMGRMDR